MTRLLRHHHVLAVSDVKRSAAFFVDVLGFEVENDDGGWAFVKRDDCMFMLGDCPNDKPAGELGSHSYVAYLVVDDVDGMHRQIVDAGHSPHREPEDEPWGMREFGVSTVDGHRLMFGQKIDA